MYIGPSWQETHGTDGHLVALPTGNEGVEWAETEAIGDGASQPAN